MIRLGVNIDHVATLRQVRKGLTPYPSLIQAARIAKKAGAHQLTIHLRGDRRHIQDSDLNDLSRLKILPLNLEMAATTEMLSKALKAKPQWVCLVPEKREELTTEGGLDVFTQVKKLKEYTEKLQRKGILVSLFIEPSKKQIWASHEVGARAVEFHTGTYALSKGSNQKRELRRLKDSFKLAHLLGLRVHAGHGLDYKNTKAVCRLPHLQEVNIGHSIICDSLIRGLHTSIREMKKLTVK